MTKRKASDLSPEQASDELVFMEFEKLLKKAKKKYEAAQAAKDEVFNYLSAMCIDSGDISMCINAGHTRTDAENANNLAEAITCFLNYGEYSVAGIMGDIRKAYSSLRLQIEAELADAHDCKENANEYGICTVCGAIIHGSFADYELHGYDPPLKETRRGPR